MEPRTDQQSARRSILVVDGDLHIQRLLDLSLRNAGFDVKTVANAPEASAWLASERPDLIVSETKLEGGADGFELCRQVKKRADAASIAFVFLAERTVEMNMRAVEAGADDFLAKPLYVQEVVAHTRALLQRRVRDNLEARTRDDEKFVGALEALPLVDLLRAIQTNRRSGAVQIQGPDGGRGEIYFRDGAVVDAEVGRLSGLDAVCRLFSWTTGQYEIEWKNIRRKDSVALESGDLLIEALRRLEEWRRLLADVAPLDTIFEVDYHVLAERLAEIPDEVNAILRLFDGQRTFIHVIDDCGLSDLDALAVIGKLHREQIIRDVRARPMTAELPGADIEGWIAESTGPFRAAIRQRRELFGAPPEAEPGVHGRVTAPVEPLEEAPREPVVGERRERFTDRLIAEGAPTAEPAAPPVRTPLPAGERTQMGLAPAPPTPPVRAPLLAAETTQQGLGAPAPALSTRPGFAAVAAPPPAAPRIAREVLTDVTPAARGGALALPGTDGVPEPVLPQSPEPAIVIPPPAPEPAPETIEAAAVGAAPAPAAKGSTTTTLQGVVAAPDVPVPAAPAATDQRPVAGEFLSRPPEPRITAKDGSGASQGGSGKRVTDLGLGPQRPSAAGEVVATKAKTEDARPIRKIILDPGIPEAQEPAASSRQLKVVLALGAGMGLAVALVWFGFKKTPKRHAETAEVETSKSRAATTTPPPKPVIEPTSGAAGAAAAPVGTSGTSLETLAHPSAGPKSGALAAARAILEERAADPKVARALPTEFPLLLTACRTAFTEKRARDAEIACVAAKDAKPDSAEACTLLGHALLNRKKRREALVWAERAVELDPMQAEAYVIIGGVKQAADDPIAAKAAYKKYLELAPSGQYATDLRAIVDSL